METFLLFFQMIKYILVVAVLVGVCTVTIDTLYLSVLLYGTTKVAKLIVAGRTGLYETSTTKIIMFTKMTSGRNPNVVVVAAGFSFHL